MKKVLGIMSVAVALVLEIELKKPLFVVVVEVLSGKLFVVVIAVPPAAILCSISREKGGGGKGKPLLVLVEVIAELLWK